MVAETDYLQFIESFNHIHKYLQKYTNSDDNVSFSDLLYRSKKHPVLSLYLADLHVFRKLRNIMVHQTDDFNQIIAMPSNEAIERIQFIEQQLVDPVNLTVFKRDVICFEADGNLKDALKISAEKEFLKFPIYEKKQFLGLVTSRGIAKWLQRTAQQDKINFTEKMKDLLAYENEGRYHFISMDTTVYEAWYLFRTKGANIEALLVTQSGKENEQIIAIITYDDLIKYLYNNDLYVFH